MWSVLFLAFLIWIQAPPGAALRITATIYPLYDLARELAPEEDLRLLIPPGADPHHFEPRWQALKALRQSDLVLAVGYETWLPRDVPPGRILLLARSPLKNPHAWLDLALLRDFLERLSARLSLLLPDQKEEIEARKKEILKKIEKLEALKRRLSLCRARTVLVLGHAALEELLKDTPLEVVSLAGPHPESEVLPGKISQALNLVRQREISVVFLLDPAFQRYVPLFQKEEVRILKVNPGIPVWPGDRGLAFLDLLQKDLLLLQEGLCTS